MKKARKLTSIILALLMLIGIFVVAPFSASADFFESGDYYCMLEYGTIRICGYTGPDSELTIPKEINGYKVTAIDDFAFSNNKNLTKVVIPEGVSYIGSCAFENCTNISSVVIPNTVTRIYQCTFSNCDMLKSITIPAGVRAIEWYAFGACKNLQTVTFLGGLNIHNSAFAYSNIKKIIIGEKVKKIDTIHNIGLDKLTNISVNSKNKTFCSIKGNLYSKNKKTLYLYAKGKTAKSFTIPNTVNKIKTNAFSGCKYLTKFVMGKNLSEIEDYAFSECKKLQTIKMNKKIKRINSYVFYGCIKLKSISLPKSVIYLGTNSFADCQNLKKISVTNNLKSIGADAFSNTKWYSSKSKGMVYIGKVAYKYKGKCPAKLSLKKGTLGIAAKAFCYQYSLKRITIPKTVVRIGSGAFVGCEKLTSVNIPKGVSTIGAHTFYNCYALKKITIPRSVKTIAEHSIGYYLEVRELGNPDDPDDDTDDWEEYDEKIEGVKIYGYKGTAAQKYANKNGFKFIKL